MEAPSGWTLADASDRLAGFRRERRRVSLLSFPELNYQVEGWWKGESGTRWNANAGKT